MPPRGPHRTRASAPKKQKYNSPIPITYSAARKVYHIAELRQRALTFLSDYHLVRRMRIGQESLEDGAKVLYRSIDYGRVEGIKAVPAPRQIIYSSAVSEIHATDYNIPGDVYLQGGGTFQPNGRRLRIHEYDPKMCHSFSTSLRTKFPNLRKVYYGLQQPGEEGWILVIPIISSTVDPSGATIAPIIGHVEVVSNLDLSLSSAPPRFIQPPARPARGYTISRRFTFNLDNPHDPVPISLRDSWVTSLRDNPMYGDLYHILELAYLPILIDDITSIIKRQVDAGHTERLKSIAAFGILGFDTDQFFSFAQLASSSLTLLYLAHGYVAERHDFGIAFRDLGTLVSIIQKQLPQLVKLRMAIHGIEGAEWICKDLLPIEAYQQKGNISELRLYTPAHDIQLFNVIRCLLPLCKREMDFSVGSLSDSDEQEYFLRYILQQTSKRRTHLISVDFALLGVGQLHEVTELEYNDDGRPQSRTIAKASEAIRDLRAAGAVSNTSISFNIDDEVRACREMVLRLESLSGEATTPGFIDEAEGLVVAI